MPIPLYDPEGKPVDLPLDAAQKAVTDGSAGPLKDQIVPIRLKNGERWDIPGHEIHNALSNGAALVDPEAEKHEAALKAQEGLGGAWDAANTGVLTGATAGLGPGLIRKGISAISPEAGKRFAEHIETQREAHPYVSLGSEVVGAAGAALVSKGASGEATAARLLPAAGIDAIGAAAEHGIARIGGRAAAQAAARASTEGALYAASDHVGEDILGDHETAADKLLVATAKGGAFGLGLGTVLGGAGSLIRGARGAARKGGGALLSEAATEATTAAEQRLAAAEAAHADATKRSFSYQDLQGEPLKGDLFRAKPGGLDDFTTPVESEPAFDMQTRRSINLGPSEGDAAYKNPHTTDAIHDTYDKSGQLVRPKAPKGVKAFDIGSMAPQVDPMSGGTRFNDPGQWEGPLKFDKNVVGLKQSLSGIEGLQPTKTGSPMHVSTDSDVLAANEKLRRGTLGEAHMPQTNADAGFSTALEGGESQPFSVAPEDPIVTARRSAAETELKAARKEFEQATKDAAEAQDLHNLSAEFRTKDPRGWAADFAWQATGANKGLTNTVNTKYGGTRRAGETAIRLGIVEVPEGAGAIKATLGSFSENTHENMLTRTQGKLDELVAQLEGIGGTKTSATLGEFLAPIDKEIERLGQTGATAPVARQLSVLRRDILSTPKFRGLLDVDGNLIQDAHKAPMALSDIIQEMKTVGNKAFATGDVNAYTMKAADAALYDAWDTLAQKALDSIEGGSGGQFKAIKTDVTDLINIKKALEGRIAGMSSGRSVGLLDHVVGHGAAMAGGALIPVVGHVVGGGVGAMLSKTLRERGNAAAAVALTKIADIGAVRHLMGVVDSKVSRAAKGLTSTAEVKSTKVRIVGGSTSGADRESKRPPIAQRYREAIEKLDAMESQASPVHQRAMEATQDLAQHAPNVAGAFATGMARAAAFLSSKRPQALTPSSPYSPREPSILDTDKLAFVKSFEAGTDPMGVLDRFEKGVVTSQDVEALQAVAPKVYEDLHQKVMAEIATRHAAGKTMPFKRRMELAMLFPDAQIEPSLDAPTYRMLQKNVFTEPPPDQPPSKGGKSNAPRRPTSGKMSNPMDAFWSKSGPGQK